MSFISSQITKGGIVMAADRCLVGKATMDRTCGAKEDFTVMLATTCQKIHVTKNNIGISSYGAHNVTKHSTVEDCMYDFLWELDTEKHKTPYEVAHHLLAFFRNLNPSLDTLFHVGGYDMADPKKPNPMLYEVLTANNSCNKVNCHEKFQGASFCSMMDFTEKIYATVGSEYRHFNLRDAIEFAKFASEATRQMMRFARKGQGISEEVDLLVIKPDGVTWLTNKAEV